MHRCIKKIVWCVEICVCEISTCSLSPFPQFLSVSLSVNTTTHIGSVLKQNFHYHHRLFFFYLNNCWTTACLYLCFCGLYNSESRTDSRVCGTRRVHKYYRVKVLGSLYDKRLLKVSQRWSLSFALILVKNSVHFSKLWRLRIYYVRSMPHCIIFPSNFCLPANRQLRDTSSVD